MPSWAEAHAKTVARPDRKKLAEKVCGNFYDLEFCLWLQRNFDYIVAHHAEWNQEKVFSIEQRNTMAAYMGMR